MRTQARAHALAIALLIVTSHAAVAQGTRLSHTSSGTVHFELTTEQLLAAHACPHCRDIAPQAGASVDITIERSARERGYTIEAFSDATGSDGAFVLQGRFRAEAEQGARAWTSPWITLRSAPTEILPAAQDQRLATTRLVPEYRLLVSGRESAGTHVVRVTYRVRETGASTAHDLTVEVPAYLVIRAVDARGAPIDARLSFDLSSNPQAYLDAVLAGRRLSPDASTFDRMELTTNSRHGYRATIELNTIGRHTDGHTRLRERVLLHDRPAHGTTLHAPTPTHGTTILFSRHDLTLALDGTEPAGAFNFLITIHAHKQP